MTNRFEYTDTDGGRLTVQPLPGVPYIVLTTYPEDASIPLDRVEEVIAGMRDMARQAAYKVAYHQPARFPGDSAAMRAAALSCVRPEKYEEPPVLAPRCVCGDPIERWSGPDSGWIHSPGSDTPCLDARPSGRRRLTELEHTAAWHAIEGTAGEDGADPGTVLAAVLHALGIDPPADQARPEAALTPPSEQRAQLLGEISVPIENALRAAGQPTAADLIVGIMRGLAHTVIRAAEMTQDEFALTPGGPGPAAAEEAGA